MNPSPTAPLAAQTAAAPPRPALPHRRGLNASLETIRQGLQPIGCSDTTRDGGPKYFLFGNGQIRRQVGQGHSTFERGLRRAQRNADYSLRRTYKRARNLESRDASPADLDIPVVVQNGRTMPQARDIFR